MLQPNLPISIFFIPYGIPGYIFGILFLALSAYLAKRGGTNIGHGAHFTGAIYGLIFTIVTSKLFADFDAVKAFLNAILNP
jgi:membrane associated rhomboid family serine protease